MHRHDQQPLKCSWPLLAVDAELFQPGADLRAVLAVLVRQAQAQRAVGVAELERVDQFRVIEAALFR